MTETGTKGRVVVATKFAPLPWRQTPGSLVGACRKSLQRLGLPKMGLYIQHWWVGGMLVSGCGWVVVGRCVQCAAGSECSAGC
jgi:aryl-alcohol dehydrogenase-like predicted oxidoreductase